MTSGWGLNGSVSRCHHFFQALKECKVNPNPKRKGKPVCLVEKLDYFECLHNKREALRIKTVMEKEKQAEGQP